MTESHTKTLLDGAADWPGPPAPGPPRRATRSLTARRHKQAASDASEGQFTLLDPLIVPITAAAPRAQDRPHQPMPTPPMATGGSTAPLSVATAIQMVETWSDLKPTRRRDLVSALQAVARMAEMPPSTVVLTPDFVRQRVLTVSAAQYGVSRSRLFNIRSQLRAVLQRAGTIDAKYLPIAPEWQNLLDRLGPQSRHGLTGFARFCTRCRVAPPMVSNETLEDFLRQVAERTVKPAPRQQIARVRNVWNNACDTIEGWPTQRLTMLSKPEPFIKPLSAFPEVFRKDLKAFGDQMVGTVFDNPGDDQDDVGASPALIRSKPVRASAAASRMSHVRWAASALINSGGLSITEVTSLGALVTPLENARSILRCLYQDAGNKPSARGAKVADVLRIVAKYYVRLPEEDLARIRKWGARFRQPWMGMTPKNDATVRQASHPARELKLMELPQVMMKTARQMRKNAPLLACWRALTATAIQLFARRMLRLANVCGLRLDRHLQRADPKSGPITHIYIPAEETKNSRVISLPVAPDIGRMLDEWINDFRPLIAAADNFYLFPGNGAGDRSITPQALSLSVKRATKNFAGLAVTPHQFRHLAAYTFLDDHPDHYEEVRRQLGHASVTTTTRYYSGLESESAARRFDEVILSRRQTLRRNPTAKKPSGPPR